VAGAQLLAYGCCQQFLRVVCKSTLHCFSRELLLQQQQQQQSYMTPHSCFHMDVASFKPKLCLVQHVMCLMCWRCIAPCDKTCAAVSYVVLYWTSALFDP
jgi:hypothetical protein